MMNSSPKLRVPLTLILAVTGLILHTGCTITLDQNNPIRPPVSETLDTTQFADVPVPLGFTLREDPITKLKHPGSYSFEAGELRLGRFLYAGKTAVDDVARFYLAQMENPYHGWSKVSEDIGPGSADLVFDKGQTRSRIELFQKGSKTYVLIEIGSHNET